MNPIENVSYQALENPKYVKVEQLNYMQGGVAKQWEIANVHDSVAVLLYHKQKDAFILVKQLRPAVHAKNGDGLSYELCAGICDKSVSWAQIAKEEIEEECGYDVPLENLEEITTFYTSVGFAGAKQTLFFATLDETMKVSDGGGIDIEEIEVFVLPVKESKAFMFDTSLVKTPGMMFAFYWFYENFKVKSEKLNPKR